MASASWKLCSMSGLQTPSASAADRSLSSSSLTSSPTSRFFESEPEPAVSAGGPELVGVHGDEILPATSGQPYADPLTPRRSAGETSNKKDHLEKSSTGKSSADNSSTFTCDTFVNTTYANRSLY